MKSRPSASRLDTAAERRSRHSVSASFRTYPFSMIVGQEEMKLALILNVIDPLIGGVLLMGHRGTGKSTAVRALADLLAEIWTVRGCHYQCDPTVESDLCAECTRRLVSGEKLTRRRRSVPLVDLPLGATEDRVCGTIDIERALKDGVKSFEPGLLARANRGFLYIDEVNLLEDHLADLLLDVAATGRNRVERESMSIEHPARFVLIGSGNPEEGELRPQLLDRFGLHVEVKTEDDLDRRVEIVERREDFENNPVEFCARLVRDQQQLRNRITRAQKSTRTVKVNRALLRQIAELCTLLKIDGHRGELTIARSARALAAFEGRRKATEDEVRRVAVMSLRHRLGRDPLEETAGAEQIRQALTKVFPAQQNSQGGGSGTDGGSDSFEAGGNRHTSERRDVPRTHRQSAIATNGRDARSQTELSQPSALDVVLPKLSDNVRRNTEPRQPRSYRLSKSGSPYAERGLRRTSLNYLRGRYSGAVSFRESAARVAIDATLRALAGAGYQVPRASHNFLPAPGARHPTSVLTAETRHPVPAIALRYKQLASKRGTLFILLIDASGSMALNRISQAKGAALSLLKESYIKRDRVAIVGFHGTAAEVLLQPSKSMLRARRVLDSLPVGGGTPLAAGMLSSLRLAKRPQPSAGEIVLLIFTDGHANVSLRNDGNGKGALDRDVIEREIIGLGAELTRAGVRIILVDSQNEFVSNGNTRELADKIGGSYVASKKLLATVAASANH